MLHDMQVKDLTVRLFKLQTERDKQRKVGASQISDPCTYHLAKALVGKPEPEFKYWLGGKLGTATHMFIEDAISKTDVAEFPELSGAVVEKKIILGELPNYGTVSSKPDLALIDVQHLIDWKTSTRDKSKKLQRVLDCWLNGVEPKDTSAVYTLQKYIAQVQLYAWGLAKAGTPVDGCSLVFINRDGTTEADIWTHTFEYDESLAEAMWSRLEKIWAMLESGAGPGEFEQDGDCFKCNMGI